MENLTQFEEEILKEFDVEFGRGGFGDTDIFLQARDFLSQALKKQRQEIVKAVKGLQKSANETMGKAGGLFYGYNQALEHLLKEIEK